MAQNIFYPGLNEFCRRYLIAGTPVSEADRMLFESRMKDQHEALFEQFLLFDTISFKVYGENILVPVLIGFLGEKGFDALIEQGAINFVLWTQQVLFFKQNIPGIDALGAGTLNSAPHADPEKSIELGLNWMTKRFSPRARRRLVKKIAPLYTITDSKLSADATSIVKSAFLAGRLRHYGLDPAAKALDTLSTNDKMTMAQCGDDITEYKFIMDNGMTSFSEYKYYSPFWDTAEKFKTIQKMQKGFRQIAAIEGFPDLRALHEYVNAPLAKLPKLRQKRNSVKFREWLETTVEESVDSTISRSYIDSISERNGLFDSAPAKFLKAISMTAIGATIGGALGGAEGAKVGAGVGGLSAGVLEAATHLGLDLLDQLALEPLTRGWTPRLFFNDLTRLRAENDKSRGRA